MGITTIFGVCMAAAPVEMVISRTFRDICASIITFGFPIVVLLIGLSLIKVELYCGRRIWSYGYGTFGSWEKSQIVGFLLSVLFLIAVKQISPYEFHCVGNFVWDMGFLLWVKSICHLLNLNLLTSF